MLFPIEDLVELLGVRVWRVGSAWGEVEGGRLFLDVEEGVADDSSLLRLSWPLLRLSVRGGDGEIFLLFHIVGVGFTGDATVKRLAAVAVAGGRRELSVDAVPHRAGRTILKGDLFGGWLLLTFCCLCLNHGLIWKVL
jgi:hypothetical protein